MKKKAQQITVSGITFNADDVISVVLNINGKIIQIAEVNPMLLGGGPPPASKEVLKDTKQIGFSSICE